MKRVGYIKFFLVAILMTITLFSVDGLKVEAKTTSTPDVIIDTAYETISPRADIIGWRLKEINGQLYKRQYNYSKNEWIGPWIKC